MSHQGYFICTRVNMPHAVHVDRTPVNDDIDCYEMIV